MSVSTSPNSPVDMADSEHQLASDAARSAAAFTNQLIALDVGEVAIKGDKVSGHDVLVMQEDAAESRKRMRNRVYASINAVKRRSAGAFADREFTIECYHHMAPSGAIILTAVVERTA